MEEEETTVESKPIKPEIGLVSGSEVLGKSVVEEFLKTRFENLPERITKLVADCDEPSYLGKFKLLIK